MLEQIRARRRAKTMTVSEGSSVFAVPTSPVDVLSVVEGLATAETNQTCIVHWRGVVTQPRFLLQRQAIEHVTNRHPGDAVILCIIEPTSEPPPQALREAAVAMLNEAAPKLRCMACVIEGSGFRAAMIRGVLSGMELMRRSSYPTRYFANVAEASMWIASQTGRPSAELVNAASRLRDRLDNLD